MQVQSNKGSVMMSYCYMGTFHPEG